MAFKRVSAPCYLLLFQHLISIIIVSSAWWLMEILTRTDLAGPHLTSLPSLTAAAQPPFSVVFNQLSINLSDASIALHHLCFLQSISRGRAAKTHDSQDRPYRWLPAISRASSPPPMETRLVQRVVLRANPCCLFLMADCP